MENHTHDHMGNSIQVFEESLQNKSPDAIKNLESEFQKAIEMYKSSGVPASKEQIPQLERKIQACQDKIYDLENESSSKGKGKGEM